MSWTEVGFAGDPIRGNIEAFTTATAKWKAVNESSVAMRTEFRSIVAGHVMVGFEGRAAEQFAKVVEEIQGVLDGLPTVSESIRSALDTHRAKLEALRRESDQALARAKMAKAECANAASAQRNCEARAASLQKQISQLRSLPEPDDAHVLSIERMLQSATQERTQRRNATAILQAQVDTELKKWDELRASEDSLNNQTANSLRSIDLLDLRDPKWIAQQFTAFKNFIGELGSDIWNANAALLRGDVDAALFHMRDALDKYLTILHLVSMILDVVALVLALTGVGLPFAALILGVSKFVKVTTLFYSAINLGAGLVLASRRATHPETGESIGGRDLFFDSVEVAIAAVGARGVTKQLADAGNLSQWNARREFITQQVGIKTYGKQIARNTTELGHAAKEVIPRGIEAGMDWFKTQERVRQPQIGGSSQGTSRGATIQRGISDIRAGRPGIVTPVMTNLVSF